jgi:L-amino acid N-acyltransferase YncA
VSLIRLAGADDAVAVAAIYEPFCESTAVSFEVMAPSADEMSARIATVGAHHPWIVLEDAGKVIGYAYATTHHERAAYQWTTSTSVYVHKAHHRHGAGRALYTTLFELLRSLGYFRATAGITLPNAASVALHRSFGFTQVGVYRSVGFKLGAWHDVAWFEAEIQPLVRDPVPPRAVASLTGTPVWPNAIARGLAHIRTQEGTS